MRLTLFMEIHSFVLDVEELRGGNNSYRLNCSAGISSTFEPLHTAHYFSDDSTIKPRRCLELTADQKVAGCPAGCTTSYQFRCLHSEQRQRIVPDT